MEREKKTLTTPLGKELVVKTYMTARERESLVTSFDGLEKEIADKVAKGEAPTLKSIDAAKKYVEIMVIAYAGIPNDGNLVASLMDLPVKEFDFVVTESINSATGDFQLVK